MKEICTEVLEMLTEREVNTERPGIAGQRVEAAGWRSGMVGHSAKAVRRRPEEGL
jgi:hypothetical protein